MTVITELTPEQEARMPEWVDMWIKIGCDTGQEIDGEACFQAVKNLYNTNEFRRYTPEKYVVVDSPLGIYEVSKDKDFINKCCFGSFEASWLSYYTYFRDVVGIDLDPRLRDLETLAKYVSLYFTHEDTVIFSRKPTEIHLDNGLLSNENGPAILFADGFAIYSIRGNQVTEQIVMHPETLTVKQIDSEQNSDIQSIMIDRFGWDRYIAESNAKLIDSRKNEIENTMEALFDTKRFGRRLVCTCPTGRVFVKGIETRKDTSTCEGAQNWLAGNRKFRTIART